MYPREVRNFIRHFRTECLRSPAFLSLAITGAFISRQNRRFYFPPKTVDSRKLEMATAQRT